jgi:hypothetical protein
MGKIPEEMIDLRADISWMKTLDLTHFPFRYIINHIDELEAFDYVILNYPKDNNGFMLDVIPYIFDMVKKPKVGIVQHGGYDYFMDWNMETQVAYKNLIRRAKFFVITNEIDNNHFKLLARDTPILFLKTDLDDAVVQQIDTKNRQDRVMISGNMTRWYGGTMSLLLAEKFGVPITVPTMGRRQPDEETFAKEMVDVPVIYLPYSNWIQWFKVLSTHKYAVNMMPVAACGSFSVACAALGIPCIGRKHITAQNICFPELSIDENYENIDDKITLIKTDYDRLSKYAREQYLKHFERKVVKEHFYEQLERVV